MNNKDCSDKVTEAQISNARRKMLSDGRKRIYVSLPISNYDLDERRKKADATAAMLRGKGYEAVTPFQNGLPQDASYEAHMAADIWLLLSCDGIYMCDGWEDCLGCKIEHAVAQRWRKEVLPR